MQRITVATDGLEGADRAVDYAAHQAKYNGAELWIEEALSSASAENLTKARDGARNIGVSMIHLESRAGDIVKKNIEIAQENAADSIVGSGRLARLLLSRASQKANESCTHSGDDHPLMMALLA
jgi:nucleotide-binding universal stress UspA family protein